MDTRTAAGHGRSDQSKAGRRRIPYFHFIPPFVTYVIPDHVTTFNTDCFKSIAVNATYTDSTKNTLAVEVTTSHRKSLFCSDFTLWGTVSSFAMHAFNKEGKTNFHWDLKKMTASEKWDVGTNGIRVFRFPDDRAKNLSDLAKTAELFGSEATVGVSDVVAKANLDFLAKYAKLNMTERKTRSYSGEPDSQW